MEGKSFNKRDEFLCFFTIIFFMIIRKAVLHNNSSHLFILTWSLKPFNEIRTSLVTNRKVGPLQRVFNDLVFLSRNSASHLAPNCALRGNQIIVLWPNCVDASSFRSRIGIQTSQELGRAWSGKRSRVESIDVAACRNETSACAGGQTQIGSS